MEYIYIYIQNATIYSGQLIIDIMRIRYVCRMLLCFGVYVCVCLSVWGVSVYNKYRIYVRRVRMHMLIQLDDYIPPNNSDYVCMLGRERHQPNAHHSHARHPIHPPRHQHLALPASGGGRIGSGLEVPKLVEVPQIVEARRVAAAWWCVGGKGGENERTQGGQKECSDK